jgi:hypothetical protein
MSFQVASLVTILLTREGRQTDHEVEVSLGKAKETLSQKQN